MIPARLKLASRHVSSSCAVHLQTATSIRKLAVHLPTSYGSRRYSLAVKTSQAGPSSTAVEGDKPSSPTKLDKIIRDTIMATGPMSVSTYMQLCLSHPTAGYYMNPRNFIFGLDGDFITSPEISQVFGELIAVWHLSRWIAASRPKKLRIIELGPGRGTLLDDAMRTWEQFPYCMAAISSMHLVETSPMLREMQLKKLHRFTVKKPTKVYDFPMTWHDSIEEILEQEVDKDTYTVVIAHEFFDALPVHLIEKCEDGWHDILITMQPDPAAKEIIKDSTSNAQPPLRLVRNPEPSASARLLGSSSPRFLELPIGARAEVSPTSFKIARQVAELVNNPRGAGGSALIIDYGRDHVAGGSLRAFKRHQIVDMFETPGDCDLTANVDFAYLKEAIQGAATSHGPISQAAFLQNMNMEARVAKLIFKAKKDKKKRVETAAAARRLVDPNGMGQQYKVLAVTGTGARKAEESEVGEVWPFVPGIKSW